MKTRRYVISLALLLLTVTMTLSSCAPAIVRRLRPVARQSTPTVEARATEVKAPPAPVSTPMPAVAIVNSDEERLYEQLYERVNPSVVNIAVAVRGRATSLLPQIPGFPRVTPPAQTPDDLQRGEGSGFVYDKRGYIITNNHVVADAVEVRVTFASDISYLAKVIGTDPDSDLAVIQVNAPADSLQPLPLGSSDTLKVGQKVIAIGNPFGLQGSMTTGIISALARSLPSGSNAPERGRYSIPDIIQTDAAINPGNSGGPLLNLQGQVVGLNAAIESPVRASVGVGFAIPVDIVKQVVPALIEKGRYDHPWLGISGQTVSPEVATAMKLPEDQRGILVAEVIKDSPAEKAGLRAGQERVRIQGVDVLVGGDIIIAIDGKPTRKFDDLTSFLVRSTAPGQKVRLSLLRGGKTIEVEVILAARPKAQA